MSISHHIYVATSEDLETYRPEIVIIPTLPQHLRELVAVLRPEDEREILTFGVSPERALWRSYRGSVMRETIYIDGEIAAIYGLGSTFMGVLGTPWLLTSPQVRKVSSLKFARIYQQKVKEMLKIYSKLNNIVDAEYTAAIRLLEIVGFKLGARESIGNKGRMFRRFDMEVLQ